MPAALMFAIGNRLYDWKYESEPEPGMSGRRVYHARGKVLGGSSSINGMIFQRGNPMDYDKWGRIPGMETWSYEHCLPYFKRMETCLGAGPDLDAYEGAELRGNDGPLAMERPGRDTTVRRLVEGRRGGRLRPDRRRQRLPAGGLCCFRQERARARRLSAARAYLHPVLKQRRNLTLKTRAQADKILFEGNKAVGVQYRQGRFGLGMKGASTKTVTAKEVISCGGAFNSPQLLQLSGVGDREHLEGLGIEVVSHLPGVGENMQDHLEVYIQYACKEPVSIQPHLKFWKRPFIGLAWLFRKGPASSNHFEAGRSCVERERGLPEPDVPLPADRHPVRRLGAEGGHGYQVHVGPMYSDAKGTVKITSTDPRQKPAVQFNYLTTEQDLREWPEAVRTARKILNQPAFDRFNGGEISPGPSVETDQEIMDWVARGGDGTAPVVHLQDGA